MKTIFLKITKKKFQISGSNEWLPITKLMDTLHEITIKGDNYIITDNNLDYLFKSLSFLYEYQKHLYIKMRGKELQGITIYERGKKWKFRNLKNYTQDICENIEDMAKSYNALESALHINLGSLYHLDNLIRRDFKTSAEYDLNFKNMLYLDEAEHIAKWKPRQLYYMNDRNKLKVIENISKYDLNNYYWDVFRKGELPYGKPIACNPNDCQHDFSLLEVIVWGKLKEDKVPLLYNSDEDGEANEYAKEIFGEKFYISSITMNKVFDHYDIDDIEIVDYICFKTKTINIDWFLNKWIKLQKAQTNSDNKTMIKSAIHKQLGLFGASSLNKTYKIRNNKIILQQGNYKFFEYSPLLLYIVDKAKERMINYIEKYEESFVACVVDSIVLSNGDFQEPISKEIGDWKLVNKSHYGFFKSTTQYVNWDESDTINYSKQSGLKKTEVELNDLTPQEAIKILKGEI